MQYLGLLLLAMVAAELLSIFLVVKLIGGLATFGLLILSFMAGSFLMKRSAGLSQLLMAGGILRSGGLSPYQLLYPIRLPVAAFLLMLPGFISDIAALLLLLPFGSRPPSQPGTHQSEGFAYRPNRQDNDDIIEGEFTVQNSKRQPENQNRRIGHQ